MKKLMLAATIAALGVSNFVWQFEAFAQVDNPPVDGGSSLQQKNELAIKIQSLAPFSGPDIDAKRKELQVPVYTIDIHPDGHMEFAGTNDFSFIYTK